jgi:ATP-dependent exoDNAse (exonuclease V) beta subunit
MRAAMTEWRHDEAARAAALDPSRSFVVQAPAGSGKTGLLTQRFLRLLAVVDAPEQIVAITFTRKAAAQMRHQVIEALHEARKDSPPGADAHARRTRELAHEALERAESRGWDLMMHPARLRIETIDAFCYWIAAQLPMLSRTGAELRVIEDARPYYAEAARRTLGLLEEGGPVAADVEVLLRHRDNQLVQTESLLIDMLGKRDQWLPIVVGLEGARLRERLERDLALEVRDCLTALRERWPAENLVEVARLAAFAAKNLGTGAGELVPWLTHDRVPDAVPATVPLWCGLAQLLLTDRGSWRKRLDYRDGIPAEARAAKSRLLALIGELARDAELLPLLATVRRLPATQLSDAQWQVAAALLHLLKTAAAQLELVFRERGEVDYAAVAQAAVTALGGAEEPAELALALDYRIHHLLVDEFQDSSHTQLRLLEALTAGWVDGDGRTLFCVGDPMQSIYRFRQAEVGLFLRTRDHGLGSIRPQALMLERNFRSAAELVGWFNEVFVRALPARDDVQRGAVRHAASVAARKARGKPAVTVHCRFSPDLQSEAVEIATLVATYRERTPEKRVGILVRQRQHAHRVAAELRKRALRFQAVELEPLIAQPAVRDLLALTRALLHLGDRTAWLALLRSPCCGLTLADLEALTRGTESETCWELLHDPARLATLSTGGQLRLQTLLQVLGPARELSGRLPVRAWVERTWLSLGGPAGVAESRGLEDAQAFFERLQEMERRGPLPAGGALDGAFQELYATTDAAAPEALQLMTIHKAKGLEFDLVILPGVGRGRERSMQPLLRWLEVPRSERDTGLLLAPIARTGSDGDALYDYVSLREAEREAFERARLLYVATTRAREHLHLFAHVRTKGQDPPELGEPESQSLLALMWPSVRDEFERAYEHRLQAHDAGSQFELALPPPTAGIDRHAADWRLPRPPPSVEVQPRGEVRPDLTLLRPEFEWAGEARRHIGIVVHGELERWARSPTMPTAEAIENSRARVRRRLEARGVPVEHLDAAIGVILRALHNTRTDARGRWIFDPAHRERRAEQALSGVVDGQVVHAVLDRTFIDAAGTRWIVDFKTGSHEGGAVEAFLDAEVERYRPQLALYARLIRGLAAEPVRVGLYFPLLGAWREWAPEVPEVTV